MWSFKRSGKISTEYILYPSNRLCVQIHDELRIPTKIIIKIRIWLPVQFKWKFWVEKVVWKKVKGVRRMGE